MCLKFMKLKNKEARRAEAELNAKERAIRDEAVAQRKQADVEAKECAKKYPCTGGAEILTARPEGMSYEKYCEMRATQTRQIRAYLKHGRLIYKAAEIYIVKPGGVEVPYTKENANTGVVMRRTWSPYRRVNPLTSCANT